MERMKQLTVCIDDGLQGEVVYRAEISHTEEDYQELKSDLEFVREENKNLKEKVRFLEECLDRKEKLNEKYRKQIDKYKRQYEHSMGEDNGKLTKGGYASFNEYGELMEADTLQWLKDLGKI